MKRKKNISKLLIGGFFLALYCNVLFTQLLCNYSHLLSELFEQTHTHKDDHHHDHDEKTPLTEHSHNDSKKDDNCCNDKTAAFFASQTNPTTISFDFKNTFYTEFVTFSNNIFINTPSVNQKGYFSYESAPPKIPDIRVFIHSFLI